MPASRLSQIAVGALVVALFNPSRSDAYHTVFSYRVDRVEADGNVYGPLDGVPNFVDEFDDGVLNGWSVLYGTAHESGGTLHLDSPGVHFPAPDGGVLDLTLVGNDYTFAIDGGGDFIATATWVPLLPEPGHHYHFSISTFGNATFATEGFGLGFQGRLDGTYVIEQHLSDVDLPHGILTNVQSVSAPINAADLTGPLMFRLFFHDDTNTMTSAFSLDGGTTWQSPFPEQPIFTNGRQYARLILSADPESDAHDIPPSTTITTSTSTSTTSSTTSTSLPTDPCVATGCRRSIVPLKGRLKVKNAFIDYGDAVVWKMPKGQATSLAEFGSPTTTTSYDLCIADGTSGMLFQFIIPAGLWRRVGSTGYRSLGVGGHGAGAVVLKSGIEGHASVSLNAKGLGVAPPPMPLALPVTVRLRSSAGVCWAAVFSAPGVQTNTGLQFEGFSD